jgi:hypothetical protein
MSKLSSRYKDPDEHLARAPVGRSRIASPGGLLLLVAVVAAGLATLEGPVLLLLLVVGWMVDKLAMVVWGRHGILVNTTGGAWDVVMYRFDYWFAVCARAGNRRFSTSRTSKPFALLCLTLLVLVAGAVVLSHTENCSFGRCEW